MTANVALSDMLMGVCEQISQCDLNGNSISQLCVQSISSALGETLYSQHFEGSVICQVQSVSLCATFAVSKNTEKLHWRRQKDGLVVGNEFFTMHTHKHTHIHTLWS